MKYKRTLKRMLLFVMCIGMIGLLIVPTYANENIQAEYKSKDIIEINIPKEENSEKIVIKVEDFINEFTHSDYLYPGLMETGELNIINNSGYEYEITDVTFYGEAKRFQKTLNNMCFDLGLTNQYYRAGTLDISDDEWFSKNKSYYNLESKKDYDTLQRMFGVNTKTDQTRSYKTNKKIGLETSEKMISYAEQLLWNKGIRVSLDTVSYPLEIVEKGNSAQDFIDKEMAKKVLDNVLGKEVSSKGVEKFLIGYKIDEEYFVNAFQGSQISLDFEIEMKRVKKQGIIDPDTEKEIPNGSDSTEPNLETNNNDLGEVLGGGIDGSNEVFVNMQKSTNLPLGDETRTTLSILCLGIAIGYIMYDKYKLNHK